MKNNIIIKKINIVLSVLFLYSCIDQMQDAGDAKKVTPVRGTVTIQVNTGFVTKAGDPGFPTEGLRAVFNNFSENFTKEGIVDERGIVSIDSLIPGIYSVNVSGKVDYNGQDYYLNGAVSNVSIFEDITEEDAIENNKKVPSINIRPAKVGPLCFREIYYCGVTPYYFRDQTYEIYNNGDEVFYLDSLCFAQLEPNVATATLPVWPDEDGVDNYVYGIVVWQISGSGKDYPLQPGESFLTSVFGAAFCIYKMDTPFDPNNWQTQVNKTQRFMKIAAGDVMDGVELLPNMFSFDMKRIPGFVDAGGTSVGATYCGKSVCRKVTGYREDGTPLYQDTNNSTDDFEVMDQPMIRRNGEKVPAWSPALNN